MKTISLSIAMSMIALCGCAAQPPATPAAGDNSANCHMTYPPGSNIGVEECKDRKDKEKS